MKRLLLFLLLPLACFGGDHWETYVSTYGTNPPLRYRPTDVARFNPRPAATINGPIWNNSQYASFTCGTTRTKHWVHTPVSAFKLVYSPMGSTETAFANAFEIAASIESPSGDIWPVTFDGKHFKVVSNVTDWVYSDFVFTNLNYGTNFWVRTFCNRISSTNYAVAGEYGGIDTDKTYWPDSGQVRGNYNGTGEGVSTSSSTGINPFTKDFTASGTIAASDNEAYFPVAILGHLPSEAKTVIISGDSIATTGQDSSCSNYLGGYIARGLLAYKIPFFNLALSGERSIDWPTSANTKRQDLIGYGKTVIVEYGYNDLAGGADADTTKTRLTNYWTYLKGKGVRVIQCTLMPRSTSSDYWLTTANQTTYNTSSLNDNRVIVNDWIRTVPSPLDGYLEIADKVESSRNSGIWKAPETATQTITATGGSATTCVLSTAEWTPYQYNGYAMYNQTQSRFSIVARNDATTLYANGATSWACSAGDTVIVYASITKDGIHPTPVGHAVAATGIVDTF